MANQKQIGELKDYSITITNPRTNATWTQTVPAKNEAGALRQGESMKADKSFTVKVVSQLQ